MRTTAVPSPLAPGKWEYETTSHYYFLDSDEYQQLSAAQKHVFLIGHRGTGKTTLVHALDWGERLSNPQLQSLLGHDRFEDGNVGCFIGLKSLSLQLLESWLYESSDPVSHLILGSYFRSIWIEEGVRATQALLGYLQVDDLASEAAHLGILHDRVLSWLPNELRGESFGDDVVLTLTELRRMASRLRDVLHSSATLSLRSPESLVDSLALGRLQSVTNEIFQALVRILDNAAPEVPWRFRMCMDEGEYLSTRARQTIRTSVRECDSPLFLVVAALSDLGTNTLTPGVPITLDDRMVINLDGRSVDELRALIDGIVVARLRARSFPCGSFSIRSFLGEPSLNDLLLSYPGSENRQLAALKKAWPDWVPEREQTGARGPSPIRSYLEAVGLADPVVGVSATDARRLDSRGYRKYQLAGYFLILAECGLRRPFFAGERVFLHMADNSIRDLLMALDLVCQENSKAGHPNTKAEFCALLTERDSPTPYVTQDRALRRLGTEKIQSFSEKVIHFTVPAKRLVDFVGRLSNDLDFGRVRMRRRGPLLDRTKFVVRLPRTPEVRDRISMGGRTEADTVSQFVDILLACGEEGFIKIIAIDRDAQEVTFRIHHSLSRYYGCTYRQPQYSTALDWSVLEDLLTSPSHRSLDRYVARAEASVISGEQLSLGEAGRTDAT